MFMFLALTKKYLRWEHAFLKGKTDLQKQLWQILVFLVRFNILAIPLYFFLIFPFDTFAIQAFTAKIIAAMLSLSGVSVAVVDGITFYLPAHNWYIQIIKDCIGWKSMLALFGMIFAVRGIGIKKRLYGMLAGVPLIFALNLIRIYSSILITTKVGIMHYYLIHDFLWQFGLVAVVLGIWWGWMKWPKEL